MEKSHILLKDFRSKTYKYMGFLSNTNLLESNVHEMNALNMKNALQTLDKKPLDFETLLPNFKWDNNLYENLLIELETLTGKTAKRW